MKAARTPLKNLRLALAIATGLAFSIAMPHHAQAEESTGQSPFAADLATPPAIIGSAPENSAEEQPPCNTTPTQENTPLACTAGTKPAKRSASAKHGYITPPDAGPSPAGYNDAEIEKAVASGNKPESVREWGVGVELRGSPVKEEHGNAERLESLGGIVKGNIRF